MLAKITGYVILVGGVLVIGGQIMAFFVNLNILKDQRIKKKLEAVKA